MRRDQREAVPSRRPSSILPNAGRTDFSDPPLTAIPEVSRLIVCKVSRLSGDGAPRRGDVRLANRRKAKSSRNVQESSQVLPTTYGLRDIAPAGVWGNGSDCKPGRLRMPRNLGFLRMKIGHTNMICIHIAWGDRAPTGPVLHAHPHCTSVQSHI
jgi:hypothetical protein